MEYNLKPGDVFLTRGHSLLSRAIRFFTRSIGEKRTKINHVGIIVEEGNLQSCLGVEALSRVRKHRLWYKYGPPNKDSVSIFRPINVNEDEIGVIVNEALEQVGKKYGYLKIITHLLDWFLLGVYFFRRFTCKEKYPICSWLVAHSFSKAGKNFGVSTGAAQPDDIWDFITNNPDKYQEIHPLKQIW